jgi:hypothetical protein
MAGERVFYRSGKAQVEIDSGLARLIRRTIANGAPEVAKALDEEAERIYAEARAGWPVKTGRSRDALDHGIRILSETKVQAWLLNASPYAKFVMLGGPNDPGRKMKGRGKTAMNELIRRPANAAGRRIADMIGERVVTMVWGRRG